ncbi:hypothetical protein Tco_0589075 [Tanacetum coccineum]
MYGSHRIRRIPEKLALAVEFDLTSSQGFVSAELAPWFLIRIGKYSYLLDYAEFSSCLLDDSAMNWVPGRHLSKNYEGFWFQAGTVQNLDTHNLFDVILDAGTALDMVRNVSAQEVKSVMFSMGNDKSPGPDGYTAAFFKEA